MQETESSAELDQTRELYRRSLNGILASLPVQTAGALRLAAIPHWFDARLLARLMAVADAAPYLAAISELSFIQPAEIVHLRNEPELASPTPERFHCQSVIRALLLEYWHRDSEQAYIAAHRTALAYFEELIENADYSERPALQREALYHQLASDEAAGRESLCTLFEDAYDRRQFGACQDLLVPVHELLPQLSPAASTWLRYFSARLDLATHHDSSIETIFSSLAAEAPDPQLAALAHWNLGQLHLHARQWSLAIASFRKSLKGLEIQKSGLYVARVMQSLGEVYQDLADKSGGRQIYADPKSASQFSRGWFYLANLPFLAYQWLVRRLGFMPSSWFFNANYQDWIIVYLLIQAGRWYRAARRQFEKAGDRRGLGNTLLALALIELRKDRWSRAENEFHHLLMDETITDSRYRVARVQLGQAELFLRRGQRLEAIAALQEVRGTFSFLQDELLTGEANWLLGRVYRDLAEPENAHIALLSSFNSYLAAGDKLSQTQVAEDLENLLKNPGLSSGACHEIETVLKEHNDRQYITRFPNQILNRFRRISLAVALPITYFFLLIFLILIGGSTYSILSILEATLRLSLEGPFLILLTVSDLLILLAGILFPLPLTVWSYQFAYRLAGAFQVYTIARRVVDIENEPPDSIQTNRATIEISKPSVNQAGRWFWSEVLKFTSVDYRFGKQISRLASGSVLTTPEGNLIIEGSTRGYRRLKQEISHRIDQTVEQTKLDFNFLDPRWTLVTVLVALVYSIYLLLSKELIIFSAPVGGGSTVNLDITQIFLVTYLYSIFLYIAITAWRLFAYQRNQHRQLPSPKRSLPSWLALLIAMISTLIVLFLGSLIIIL